MEGETESGPQPKPVHTDEGDVPRLSEIQMKEGFSH